MIHQINIEAHLQWQLAEDKATGHVIASCDALNLVMSGVDQEDLRANISETINLFFAALLKEGALDRFLTEHGWTASASPSNLASEEVEFQVPWELVAANARGMDGRKRAAH